MEPRSGGGWLRVGGRVCRFLYPSNPLLEGLGVPATLAGAQQVGPKTAPDFSTLLEVSQDLPPPLRALAGGGGGVRGQREGVGGRPCAHARERTPWGRGAAGGAGRRLRLSFLWSLLLLFVECWVSPPLPSGKGKEGNRNGRP